MKDANEVMRFINSHLDEISRQFGVKKLDYLEVWQKTMQLPEVILIFMYHFLKKTFGILQVFIHILKKNLGEKIDIVTDHPYIREFLKREIENSVLYG